MARRRYTHKSLWMRMPLWVLMAALVCWGLWQAEQFRRALLEQAAHKPDPPAIIVGAATVPAQELSPQQHWAVQPDPPIPVNPTIEGLDPPTRDDFLDDPMRQPVAPPLLASPAFDPQLADAELAARGHQLIAAGQVVSGRFALNAALARTHDPELAAGLRQTLSALNPPVFLGTAILADDPAVRLVDIQPGDSFTRLARTYGLPAAFLEAINPTLNAQYLRPLTGVKIVQGPFHARICKRDTRLDLYARDIFVRSYPVAFPEGNILPRGDYQIAPGTKLQLAPASPSSASAARRTWIGFRGLDDDTQQVSNGWIFASGGPRGTSARNRATGIQVLDDDLLQLYLVLSEGRSHLRVEP